MPSPQIATSYGRPNRHRNILFSIGAAVAGVLLAYFVGYASLLLSVGSVQLAWRSHKDDDHPAWLVAMVLSSVSLALTAFFHFRHYF